MIIMKKSYIFGLKGNMHIIQRHLPPIPVTLFLFLHMINNCAHSYVEERGIKIQTYPMCMRCYK